MSGAVLNGNFCQVPDGIVSGRLLRLSIGTTPRPKTWPSQRARHSRSGPASIQHCHFPPSLWGKFISRQSGRRNSWCKSRLRKFGRVERVPVRSKLLSATVTTQELDLYPMQSSIKAHAAGGQSARCGRRCSWQCLQLQGMSAMYEVYGGVLPCTGGEKCLTVKSHLLRPMCTRTG